MCSSSEQLSAVFQISGLSGTMPYLPITLTHKNRSVEAMALLNTGASISVLSYEVGKQLGAVWEKQTVPIQLSGNLAQISLCNGRVEWSRLV